MKGEFRIPPIRMAEVFVDGNCIGFLSDVKLSKETDGAFTLEGDWSGYSNVLGRESLFTISIPRHDFKFLADDVDPGQDTGTGRIKFNGASYIPDGPNLWLDQSGEVS